MTTIGLPLTVLGKFTGSFLTSIRKLFKLTQGKRKFTPLPITADKITNERLLQIVLLNVERKWATGMDLQQELTNAGYEIKKLRSNIKRQFHKAAKLADEFMQLCKEVGNDQTILQAEAYKTFMQANSQIMEGDFNNALSNLKRSHKILESLSTMKDTIEQIIYKDRLTIIENSIRLCEYNLKTEDKQIFDASKFVQTEESEIDKRLKELQKPSSKEAEVFSVTYNGVDIPIKNEKLRVMFEKCHELEQQIEKEADLNDKLNPFTDIFNLLSDMVRAVKRERQDESQSENMAKIYGKLLSYLQNFKLKLLIRKTFIYLENFNKEVLNKRLIKLIIEGNNVSVKVKPQEMIKLYENLIEYQNSLSSLEKENNERYDTTFDEFSILVFQTFRKFFSSLIYIYNKKFQDANTLMHFIKEEIRSVFEFLEVHKKTDSQEFHELLGKIKDLSNFTTFLTSLLYVAVVKKEKQSEKQVTRIKTNSNLYDIMNSNFFKINEEFYKLFANNFKFTYEEYKESLENQNYSNYTNLINFPPKISLLNPKPIIYDMAFEAIHFPDLSERSKKQEGSMLGKMKSFFWN